MISLSFQNIGGLYEEIASSTLFLFFIVLLNFKSLFYFIKKVLITRIQSSSE